MLRVYLTPRLHVRIIPGQFILAAERQTLRHIRVDRIVHIGSVADDLLQCARTHIFCICVLTTFLDDLMLITYCANIELMQHQHSRK